MATVKEEQAKKLREQLEQARRSGGSGIAKNLPKLTDRGDTLVVMIPRKSTKK